ncbi:LacI family transcriptional regulator [Gracilibacillus caseinilyticus]|uniref:LacI family transcriptional regulator n=1 Tax=Gracilibacillus caseinilyticus TaxID=2932256 RepID=A0ABY4EZG3_9BACI|nr:LacI family DNA-binding transcriptional regulator [Gracilibacillus caseinilyticus]UOQ49396.1 LacI family transcriptional regulator [Gracilibacillus caseinilyticus]
MRITAKTIAEQLNMSPATVDRVLHNRGGVSPKTVNKVLAKAKELNYTPNKSASFLARKKLVNVAFVFPEYPEYFWKEIEMGIHAALEDFKDYGFHIDIRKTPHTIEKQMEVVQTIIQSEAYDGLVICPTDGVPLTSIIESGINNDFPIFTFNNDSPSSGRISHVGADYYDAGRLAAELSVHFTGNSKRFAIITDEANTYQMQQKRRGFEAFALEHQEVDAVKLLRLDNQSMEQSLTEIKKNLADVDSVYVACGSLAEVAQQVKQLTDKPVLIGHDMSNAIYDSLHEDIVMATICQDPTYQGSLAVRLAFNYLMLNKLPVKESHIVKLEIVTKGNAKYYLN